MAGKGKAAQGYIDAAVKHQIFLQRFVGTSNKQLLGFIRDINASVQNLLEAANDQTLTKARYKKLLSAIRDLESEFAPTLKQKQKEQLKALAAYEADFTARLLDRSANIEKAEKAIDFESVAPTTGQLRAAAGTDILNSRIGYGDTGQTVSEVLNDFTSKQVGQAMKTVRQGFATGQPVNQMANDIAEALGSKVNRNQAQAIARTTVNHVASQSRNTFYNENKDILSHYKVIAILDGRTTITCQALDGKIFPIDEFSPPPYHWNCRTTFIGIPKTSYIDLPAGDRAAKGSDGVEHVAANTDYGSWIKRQDTQFKVEVLGTKRAKLLDAGMPIEKFVDERYKPITLDELRTKDNEHIFKKAGL
jgi:SPP1 gp7 family putative phage head morphogenesis protein